MSRKRDNRLTSGARPRSLTSHYGSSPSMLSSVLGTSQYSSPYSNNYSNSYSPSFSRNYNPYSAGFGRASSSLGGIYGGTSSGYGGVYLGSLNLMTPQNSNVLKKLDKKLLASQKNFKPKEVPPMKVREVIEAFEVPPVRPERKSRAAKQTLNKERSRSLTSLQSSGGLNSRTISLNSLASDGYCSGSERTADEAAPDADIDYKALYEEASIEIRRLRALLSTSHKTVTRLTELNQNSLTEIDKREKRAMERKLSEMEEELKYQQVIQQENQRLKDENGALIRVISKLSK